MAQSLGTDQRTSLNVELNIVPFIDLMSCLTAFLLVTAVWVNIASLQTTPAGRNRENPGEEPLDPKLSVLIEADAIWIGVSRINEFEQIPRTADGYDWAKVEAALRVHKASPYFSDTQGIEIAAGGTTAHPVEYQALVQAMDVAVKSGFKDVGVTDPQGLSARVVL